ncbi:glycosyltransferase family 4 protein [Blastomonas sp.]|uniref:glycosyltransferase family 4 protein n=1 Tax=Blastomonas sp. TaxID=1909299 RepID=UPI002615C613|nr:glycosyltransferase family 4 protein [Blastomonas sp.]MDM7957535.1 glycosyltransferase family 4 protein [Blastomonas sp.]
MFFANDAPGEDQQGSSIVTFPRRQAERRVTIISTYPPRQCGLATFAADVVEKVGHYFDHIKFDIWAMTSDTDSAGGSVGEIRASDAESYRAAAAAINATPTDAVWLQHEFGIYGGPDGEMIIDLVNRIAAPLIVTFHTVLENPSDNQRRIIDHLVSRCSRIMVMSPLSRERLMSLHHAPREIIDVIEHGAPDRPFGREAKFKAERGLGNRPVLTTFGLLGRGKGLESVIEALPAIMKTNPDVCYRIVGATHPNLVAVEGERYRDELMAIAHQLGVAHAIEWENRFLDTGELLDQLEACDIYLTPYPNLQQSTSGTLSYAVALGKAVVSTPYIHARELLADGVGLLIEPQSASGIANAVCSLLADPDALAALKRRAYQRGRQTIWPRFADAVELMIERTVARPLSKTALAQPSFDGVRRMTDSTGMLQHAIGTIPDRRHGYCLDDNVRALMLVNVTTALDASEQTDRSTIHASFIQHAWNPDNGRFRNFMGFDRQWLEDCGSEDSNGRAIWALAHTAVNNPDKHIRDWATRLYDEALDHSADLDSPRTLAFITLAAALMLQARPAHGPSRLAAHRGAEILAHLLEQSRRPDWTWFEAVLAYDNPRMPQALISAGSALGRTDWLETGLDTLRWICERQTTAAGHFRPIGSEGFGMPYAQMPFDQQPVEAQATLDACATAFAVDGGQHWRHFGLAAWNWFFGANDRGEALAHTASGLCRDGINPRGANLNCGAESILAFQLGYHSMVALMPDEDQHSGDAVEDLKKQASRATAYP